MKALAIWRIEIFQISPSRKCVSYWSSNLHTWTLNTTITAISLSPIHVYTDYWHPERGFFLWKSQTFGLGQTNWDEIFWCIWGIFSQFISTNFVTVGSLSMFSISQPSFQQKLSLYTQIPTIFLGVRVKFGPERIRNLVIVCP